jgi:hypothetical protein
MCSGPDASFRRNRCSRSSSSAAEGGSVLKGGDSRALGDEAQAAADATNRIDRRAAFTCPPNDLVFSGEQPPERSEEG